MGGANRFARGKRLQCALAPSQERLARVHRRFAAGIARPPGAPQGFLKIGQDVSERRIADERLRASEERLRLMGELVPAFLWQMDAAGNVSTINPRRLEYTGQSLEEARNGGWFQAIHPDDRATTERVFAEAMRSGQPVEHQHRLCGSDGECRWFLIRQTPWRDENGDCEDIHWFGAATDIHELRRLQERQGALVAELQHRTRNLIGVVRSLARQTLAHTGPTEAFRDAFEHRLDALSRVQGLLSRAEQEPITLRALLQLELDALGAPEGERLALRGPPVRIRSSHVQTLALALHELATNARKYGALAEAGGRLSVAREVRSGDAGQGLHIEWQEEDVSRSEVDWPFSPEGGGYGRRLIEQALPYALGARTTYALGPRGLRCTIDLPLDSPENLRRPQP